MNPSRIWNYTRFRRRIAPDVILQDPTDLWNDRGKYYIFKWRQVNLLTRYRFWQRAWPQTWDSKFLIYRGGTSLYDGSVVYCHVWWVPWRTITGSGLDDWICWHFFKISINYNSSKSMTVSDSLHFLLDYKRLLFCVTDLILIYESLTSSFPLSAF
jgi:hypothetical protein